MFCFELTHCPIVVKRAVSKVSSRILTGSNVFLSSHTIWQTDTLIHTCITRGIVFVSQEHSVSDCFISGCVPDAAEGTV
jgi:hypothetical protein